VFTYLVVVLLQIVPALQPARAAGVSAAPPADVWFYCHSEPGYGFAGRDVYVGSVARASSGAYAFDMQSQWSDRLKGGGLTDVTRAPYVSSCSSRYETDEEAQAARRRAIGDWREKDKIVHEISFTYYDKPK
jgi:hypothetical protein